MKNIKSVLALALVAGFASTSFAQGYTSPNTPAAPTAKVVAPAAATAEKKVEAPKAAEPAKVEVAKTTAAKDEAKPAKVMKHHHKAKKAAAKTEAAPAPMSK